MDSVASDLIFKLVFSAERSANMLIHLLNSIIVGAQENPIVGVTVMKTELTPEYVGGKEVRLDVLAKASDGRIINVEMQRKKKENFIKRSMFSWAELYFNQLPKGGDFIDLHQTICINILEESLFKDDRFWHVYHPREDETHELLTNDQEIHFLEIRKMKKFEEDIPVTWWIEYIKDPHSDIVNKIGEFEPVIKEAVKMFDYVTSDPQTRELIRIREGGLRDYNSDISSAERRGIALGKEEGIALGATREKRELARSALLMNLPIDQISQLTGLSANEIQSLKPH
jgi:predicted transposase/invertase (TIGR01784 family)